MPGKCMVTAGLYQLFFLSSSLADAGPQMGRSRKPQAGLNLWLAAPAPCPEVLVIPASLTQHEGQEAIWKLMMKPTVLPCPG